MHVWEHLVCWFVGSQTSKSRWPTVGPFALSRPEEQLTGSCDSGMLRAVTNEVLFFVSVWSHPGVYINE
jgi:hypothetical protein